MRIEVNIEVVPKDAAAIRRCQARSAASRRAAQLAVEGFEELSFIDTLYFYTQQCTSSTPARVVLTSHHEGMTGAYRKLKVSRDMHEDRIYCALVNEVFEDDTLVTRWPDILNFVTAWEEGWNLTKRVLEPVRERLVYRQRAQKKKTLNRIFTENGFMECRPPQELAMVKLLEGEEVFMMDDDIPMIRSAVLRQAT